MIQETQRQEDWSLRNAALTCSASPSQHLAMAPPLSLREQGQHWNDGLQVPNRPPQKANSACPVVTAAELLGP